MITNANLLHNALFGQTLLEQEKMYIGVADSQNGYSGTGMPSLSSHFVGSRTIP